MRKMIFGAAILIASSFAVMGVDSIGSRAYAAVVSVTESQVRNVCGSALQSNGGAIGCRKGATDYNCHKGKCQAISRVGASPSTQGVMTGASQKTPTAAPTRNLGSTGTLAMPNTGTRAVQQQGTFQKR